jgi:hypothetical protein
VIKEGEKIIWDSQSFKMGVQGVEKVEEIMAGFLIKAGSGLYSFELFGK